tara:strand:- start:383 stop:1267 length:885 start_codon:yes stop_codon:yes gene_type:complete
MSDFINDDFNNLEEIFQAEELKRVVPVSGGCIHKAWCLELLDGKKFFAKTASNENISMFAFEANCLNSLQEFNDEQYIKIPTPIKIKTLENNSILLFPWLDLSNGDQTQLGKGLALIHKKSTSANLGKFGWEQDGFIGMSIQKGGWSKNWGDYFINFRLKPQLDLAFKNGLIEFDDGTIFPTLINFLNRHKPYPSLVHGDLWSGNSSVARDKKGILYDPASYWADREVDIAMTQLFGGFSKEFYDGYNSIWALNNTFNDRKDIYNLYHVLNHANLFGGSYITQSINLLRQITII